MFRLLANLLTLRLVGRLSAEAERQWELIQSSVRRTAYGLMVLKAAASLLWLAAALLLAGLFLLLADEPRFIMPSVWTGLSSLGASLVAMAVAGLLMRR